MEINMDWYRVFYWTAKLGSLTKAAVKLHITQPAISHTLKQLESNLGGQLFFRHAKGVTLTAEGEILYSYVEQAMLLIANGEKKLEEMQELSFGEMNIGASDTLCKHYLLPQLENFHKHYPEIKIRVTNRTTPETLTLLKEGKIDFGLVNLPIQAPTVDLRIDFRIISTQQDCLVGNSEYAALAKTRLALEEIHNYPLLLLEGGSTRVFLDAYARANGTSLKPEFELGSLDLLIQFAQRGFGLAFVVREYVAEELKTGSLVEVPLLPPIPERHIGIATLQGIPLSAAAKRFLAYLE